MLLHDCEERCNAWDVGEKRKPEANPSGFLSRVSRIAGNSRNDSLSYHVFRLFARLECSPSKEMLWFLCWKSSAGGAVSIFTSVGVVGGASAIAVRSAGMRPGERPTEKPRANIVSRKRARMPIEKRRKSVGRGVWTKKVKQWWLIGLRHPPTRGLRSSLAASKRALKEWKGWA